jgi:AraC-like DNA-binding protein
MENMTNLTNITIVSNVQDYIDANLDGCLTLEELADVGGFSPYYFHKLFKQHTGECIAQYVKRTRLENSASQLIHTDWDITEIARLSGYETPSSFCRAFKQRFGFSPREYRKEMKNIY